LKAKTPAQAAGLTDHQWTLRELLTFNAVITSKITYFSQGGNGAGIGATTNAGSAVSMRFIADLND
jgi:hypothetical protein